MSVRNRKEIDRRHGERLNGYPIQPTDTTHEVSHGGVCARPGYVRTRTIIMYRFCDGRVSLKIRFRTQTNINVNTRVRTHIHGVVSCSVRKSLPTPLRTYYNVHECTLRLSCTIFECHWIQVASGISIPHCSISIAMLSVLWRNLPK